jgi:hypothetical protein
MPGKRPSRAASAARARSPALPGFLMPSPFRSDFAEYITVIYHRDIGLRLLLSYRHFHEIPFTGKEVIPVILNPRHGNGGRVAP